jgi:hypothetical protein
MCAFLYHHLQDTRVGSFLVLRRMIAKVHGPRHVRGAIDILVAQGRVWEDMVSL